MSLSLIETVRVRLGQAPLWPLHLRRLVASCRALGVPFPLEFEVPAGGEDRVHRIEVGLVGKQVSERPVGSVAPVRLITARTVHEPYPHKTTQRTQFEAAAAEARAAGADDTLLLDRDGHVTECGIWSLFWWEGDALMAPALELGILPGVARARIAELMTLEERRVPRRELDRTPLFVANAARGIVPVATIDGRIVAPHAQTARLDARFWS